MAKYDDVAKRWRDIQLGWTDKRPLHNERMPVRGERIYSYGDHFEIARPLRNKRGEVTRFLLNGDTWGQTTSRHQATVRSAIDRAGIPRVIIPYSAIVASGIDLDSVEILEATPDERVPVERVTTTRPKFFDWAEPDGLVETERPDGRIEYRWTDHVHRLGESLIRGRIHIGWRQVGPDTWNRELRFRTAKFLSGFDVQESSPLYFFCELPRTTAVTVTEAYDVLKPDVVKLGEQMNRPVKRQGDIFAVGLSGRIDKRGLRKQGARFERRGVLLNTNHVATEVARMPDGTTLVRGVLTHAPDSRRPDHKRVRLADGWHVVVKNTVPLSA